MIVKAAQVVNSEAAATPRASTQEESWMVLAAGAMAAQAETQDLAIDGAPHQGFIPRASTIPRWRKPVTIINQGKAPVRIAVGVSGRPTQKEPAESHGYKIERSFYRLDGTPVEANAIAQNERLVVALKITETEAAYARLILEDRLPAGLEIDNPDLFDGGSTEELQWVKAEVAPTHKEAKDDRFVAAFERNGSDKAAFAIAYIVRAVSPGKYRAAARDHRGHVPARALRTHRFRRRSRFREARRSERDAPARLALRRRSSPGFSAWRSPEHG